MNFVKESHEDMSEERVTVKLLFFDVQSVQKEIVGHIVQRTVHVSKSFVVAFLRNSSLT